jgi:phage-related protein
MMAGAARLSIIVSATTKAAEKALGKAAESTSRFGKAMKTAAIPAAAVGAAAIAGAKQVIDAASRQQQAMGGLEAVFGKQADTVKGWAATAVESAGLSASAYAELAAKIGANLKNAGLPMDQVMGKTQDLIALGADLAAAYGGSTQEAVEALGAALRGEADPAERYGLALNQTRINAELAAKGQDKLKGAALAQAKATAVVELATKQAGGALGQFGREADTVAGQQQRAAAEWENAQATLGQALLPAATRLAQIMATVARIVGKHPALFMALASAVTVAAGAILALNVAAKAWNLLTPTMQKGIIKIGLAMKSAFLTNPVFLVIAAIALLVAGVILLYKHNAKFRAFVQRMWAGIQAVIGAVARFFVRIWQAAFAVVSSAVQAIGAFFATIWAAVAGAVGAVGRAIATAFRVAFAIIVTVVRAYVWLIVGIIRGIITVVSAVIRFVAPAFRKAFALVSAIVRLAMAIANLALRVFLFVVLSVLARLIRGWNRIFKGIVALVRAAMRVVRAVVAAIAGPIRAVLARIRSVWQSVMRAITGYVRANIAAIRAIFRALSGPVRAVINGIKSAWRSGVAAIRTVVRSAISAVRSAFATVAAPARTAMNAVKTAFSNAMAAIKRIVQPAITTIKGWISGVKNAASGVTEALTRPFREMAGWIDTAIRRIESLIGWLGRIHVPKVSLPKVGGSAATVGASVARAGTTGPVLTRTSLLGRPTASGTASGTGTPVVINVNGALDPEAVARQIETLLRRRATRIAGIRRSGYAGAVA